MSVVLEKAHQNGITIQVLNGTHRTSLIPENAVASHFPLNKFL